MGSQRGTNAAHASIRRVEDAMLEVLGRFSGKESAEVVRDALEPTFKKARDVYTPKRTGALRASGFLEVVQFRGNARVDIGFGRGGNPAYAAMVHENIDVFHAAPTRSKFLQAAVMEDLGAIEQRLGRGYKDLLDRRQRRRRLG